MENSREALWRMIADRLIYPATGLIYDRTVTPDTPLPTAEEIASDIPTPNGNGTVMEDCMITGGTALHGLSIRLERGEDCADTAETVARGLLRCAEAGKDGYLPRGLHPLDGKLHYRDCSRDQLTMFLYGLLRYAASGACPAETAGRAAAAVSRIADRAVRNVTPETGWDLLTEDGRPTVNGIMWGDGRPNHETFRLPMLFLAAHVLTGRDDYLERYLSVREEGLSRSLPMLDGGYWALYTLQQMTLSLDTARRFDPDASFRRRAGGVMDEIARFAASLTGRIRSHIAAAPPDSFRVRTEYTWFYYIQDAAILPMLEAAAPGVSVRPETVALFRDALARLDPDGTTALPVHFAAALEMLEE